MKTVFRLNRTIAGFRGDTLTVRYPKLSDFPIVWAYARDLAAEDTCVLLNRIPSRAEERRHVADMIRGMRNKTSIHILALASDTRVAGIGDIHIGKYRNSHVGHIGISLRPEFRDQGIGTQMMRILIDEARRRGLRLLTLYCFEENSRAIHVYEKLGFVRYGLLPRAISFKGTFMNEISMYLSLET